MSIILDAHIHMYPCYNFSLAIQMIFQNLSILSPNATPCIFLTESEKYHFFKDLMNDPNLIGAHFKINKNEDFFEIINEQGKSLFVFPGRQIITEEKIEIHALATDINIKDGQPANEVIDNILNLRGIAALPWAPGKWFFQRGKLIKSIITNYKNHNLLISDSTLRPNIWPKPLLMRKALKNGLKIICGSDPLPFSNEEKYMGSYGSFIDLELNYSNPSVSIKKILCNKSTEIISTGNRNGPYELFKRLLNNHKNKKNTLDIFPT